MLCQCFGVVDVRSTFNSAIFVHVPLACVLYGSWTDRGNADVLVEGASERGRETMNFLLPKREGGRNCDPEIPPMTQILCLEIFLNAEISFTAYIGCDQVRSQ